MKILIPICFIVFIVSCWNRNDLPSTVAAEAILWEEPLQEAVAEPAFPVESGGSRYEIQPLYDYDLYGLVVSYRHHNAKFGLHKSWGDHLNVADFCVVWGNNVKSAQLSKLNFWNGQFTCNVKTRNSEAWQSFDMFQLSNNHLLTNDDFIRDQLNDIKIGDQIRIRGKLANYEYGQGGTRGTSTTRLDTGNGACETIYVEYVEVLKSYTSIWRKVMYGAGLILLGLLIWYFNAPHKVH